MKIIYLYRTKKGKLAQAIFHAKSKRENQKTITFFLKNDKKIRIKKDFILSIENEDWKMNLVYYLYMLGFMCLFGSLGIHLESIHQQMKAEKKRQERLNIKIKGGK